MIESIRNPLAIIRIRWLSVAAGGRKSGPPTANVYATTAVFVRGDDVQVEPGWPTSASSTLSILLERISEIQKGSTGLYKADFLARDIAARYLFEGVNLLIMEGPKIVAEAVVIELISSVDP